MVLFWVVQATVKHCPHISFFPLSSLKDDHWDLATLNTCLSVWTFLKLQGIFVLYDWKFICSSARFCSFRECLTVFIPSILLHLKKKRPRASTLKEEEDTILYSLAVVWWNQRWATSSVYLLASYLIFFYDMFFFLPCSLLKQMAAKWAVSGLGQVISQDGFFRPIMQCNQPAPRTS